MALSGSVSTNTGTDGRYYKLSWTATQSVPNNTSTISYTLTANGAGSEWIAERKLYATIDGTYIFNSSDRVNRYAGTIKTGTITLNHNSEGAKSFTITLGAAVYYSNVNCTGSNTFTLDTIPRASSFSLTGGELGKAHTITIDRKSNSFTHTLTWATDSYSGTICNKSTATSLSFTPELKLANDAPYGKKVYCEFLLTTYNGSTAIGTSRKTVWFLIPKTSEFYPSIDNVVITEPSGQGHISKYGGYVEGHSKAVVTITASGRYNAIIKNYKTVLNNQNEYSGASFTTGFLGKSSVASYINKFEVTVTDSRGLNDSVTEQISVLPYSRPRIYKLSVQRCDFDGTNYTLNDSGSHVVVTYSYGITSLSNKNSKNAALYYRKQTDSNWTKTGITVDYTVKDNHRIFEADDASVYDVKLVVNDDFASVSSQTSVSPGFSVFHLPSSGKGITFGAVTPSSKENGFNVYNMPAYFDKGIKENIPMLTGYDVGSPNEIFESGNYYLANIHGSPNNLPFNTNPDNNGWLTVRSLTDNVGTYRYFDYMTQKGIRWHKMFNTAGQLSTWIRDTPADKLYAIYARTISTDVVTMDWTYRIWTSGVMEVWGTKSVTNVNVNNSKDGVYYSKKISLPYFDDDDPYGFQKFVNKPVLNISGGPTGSMHFAVEFESTANAASFCIISFKQLSNLSCDVMLHAIGEWKTPIEEDDCISLV